MSFKQKGNDGHKSRSEAFNERFSASLMGGRTKPDIEQIQLPIMKAPQSVTQDALTSIQGLIECKRQIEYRWDFARREQSRLDKTRVDILHYLELEKLPACKMMKLTSELKKTLKLQRAIKDEIYLLQEWKEFYSSTSISKCEEKVQKVLDTKAARTYNVRTITLEQLLGE